MSASAPPARRPRARLLVAMLVTIAALTLTACEDGEGLRDEGPAALHDPGTAKGHPDNVRAASRP
ncbi:hypothetical protein ACFY5C_29890 [Streptomyces sp. NPDC012935]|uniref:hypothetical protein n=1 Tax=Streptomyces sp. NPDC012935 TaxID=3364857 RepID=UPI0036777049